MKGSALAIFVLSLGMQAAQSPPPPAGQPPPAATGAISGVVIDESTGAALADAVVYLSAASRAIGVQPRQFTDAKGRFAFTGLPPGTNYAVSASKTGYLTGGYSLESLAGARNGLIALEEGEWISTVRVLLTRTGAISGTVMDESGEPLVGVSVRLIARIAVQGQPRLASGPMTTTDDRGAYRFSGLAPGRYLVAVPSTQATVPASASFGNRDTPVPAIDSTPSSRLVLGRAPLPPPPRDGTPLAYPYTFAPGTAVLAQAGVIELRSGDDRTGADVRLEPVPTGRVSGTVEGPAEAWAGAPRPETQTPRVLLTLRLLADGLEGLGHGSETATALVGADGRFEFLNVPAGTYTLDAPINMSEFALMDGARSALPTRAAPPPGIGGWSMNSSDFPGAPPGVRRITVDFRNSAPSFVARTTVAVRAGDTTSVTLQLRPLGRMTARIVVDPDSPKPAEGPPPVLPGLVLDPANGDPTSGNPSSEFDSKTGRDRVTINGLQAVPYVLRIAGAGGGWTIKTAMWRGRDYTDEPFDGAAAQEFDDVVVTVTRAAPTVSGTVRDERGQVADAAAVIIFPVNPAAWTGYGLSPSRIRMARTSSTGAYRVSVPAGDYGLIVVRPNQAMAWQDPAFLEKSVAGAVRLSVDWGAQATRDLVIK